MTYVACGSSTCLLCTDTHYGRCPHRRVHGDRVWANVDTCPHAAKHRLVTSREIELEPEQTEVKTCPYCGAPMEYVEVDVDVVTLRGPAACDACGYVEDHHNTDDVFIDGGMQ